MNLHLCRMKGRADPLSFIPLKKRTHTHKTMNVFSSAHSLAEVEQTLWAHLTLWSWVPKWMPLFLIFFNQENYFSQQPLFFQLCLLWKHWTPEHIKDCRVSPVPLVRAFNTYSSQLVTLKTCIVALGLTAEPVPGMAGLKGCLLTGRMDNAPCLFLLLLPVTSCGDLTKLFNICTSATLHSLPFWSEVLLFL